MRWGQFSLLGIYFSLLSFNASAQDNSIREDCININSHQLHYYFFGKGSMTIVLDVGLGDTYRDWLPLLEKLSNKAQIFCYDRAGYGQSEIDSLPRNCERAADDLQKLLEKANIQGPYLLIGHSLGAANLQVFASENKNNIAGLILLDPPPLDWLLGKGFPNLTKLAEQTTNQFRNLSEMMKNSDDEGEKNKAKYFRSLASEHEEMFSTSGEQIAAISSFEDIPLIVIASGKSNPAMGDDAESFQKFWNDQCKRLAEKSSMGKYILAPESGHLIHIDEPKAILNAINNLLHGVSNRTGH